MSHETQVDHSLCAANCPMIATNSKSTTGGGDWLCFIHFAAEGKRWGHISDELRRLSWLVDIVRALRMVGRRKNYDEVREQARQAFILAQRGDLNIKDSESMGSWMIRLEGVLAQSCKEGA
jgi:hypothetical protein